MPKKRKSQEKPRRVDEVKKANVGEDLSQLVKIRLVNESGEQLDKDLDVQVGSEVALFQAFLNGLKPQVLLLLWLWSCCGGDVDVVVELLLWYSVCSGSVFWLLFHLCGVVLHNINNIKKNK